MGLYLDGFGTAPDGRLFSGVRGAMLSENSYGRIWAAGPGKGLHLSPGALAARHAPYDLRHSGVSRRGLGR